MSVRFPEVLGIAPEVCLAGEGDRYVKPYDRALYRIDNRMMGMRVIVNWHPGSRWEATSVRLIDGDGRTSDFVTHESWTDLPSCMGEVRRAVERAITASAGLRRLQSRAAPEDGTTWRRQ